MRNRSTQKTNITSRKNDRPPSKDARQSQRGEREKKPPIKGPQGPQGQKGDQGERGLRGVEGYVGLDGRDGRLGEKGDQGERGPQGIQGERGFVGPHGNDGKHGRDGESGPPGDRGVPGLQGDKGDSGCSGRPGERGYPGAVGPPSEDKIKKADIIKEFTRDHGVTIDNTLKVDKIASHRSNIISVYNPLKVDVLHTRCIIPNNTLTVKGKLKVNDDTELCQDLGVAGNAGVIGSLNVGMTATFEDVCVNGDLEVDSITGKTGDTISISGAVSINGSLKVNGMNINNFSPVIFSVGGIATDGTIGSVVDGRMKYIYNIPECVTCAIVEVWGSGGNGGLDLSDNVYGGGGGGAYSRVIHMGFAGPLTIYVDSGGNEKSTEVEDGSPFIKVESGLTPSDNAGGDGGMIMIPISPNPFSIYGSDGSNGVNTSGGNGGNSGYGGAGGAGGVEGTDGQNGQTPGGGGGGRGVEGSDTSSVGGRGGDGLVIIQFS
jgi:ethanolamine utilization microcompartment shell protein EutS